VGGAFHAPIIGNIDDAVIGKINDGQQPSGRPSSSMLTVNRAVGMRRARMPGSSKSVLEVEFEAEYVMDLAPPVIPCAA